MAEQTISILIQAVNKATEEIKKVQGQISELENTFKKTQQQVNQTNSSYLESIKQLQAMGNVVQSIDSIMSSYQNLQIRIENAELRLIEARQSLNEQTQKAQQMQQEYNQAVSMYGENSKQAQTASQNLENAQNNLESAQRRLEISQNNLNRANNSAFGIYVNMGLQLANILIALPKITLAVKAWEFAQRLLNIQLILSSAILTMGASLALLIPLAAAAGIMIWTSKQEENNQKVLEAVPIYQGAGSAANSYAGSIESVAAGLSSSYSESFSLTEFLRTGMIATLTLTKENWVQVAQAIEMATSALNQQMAVLAGQTSAAQGELFTTNKKIQFLEQQALLNGQVQTVTEARELPNIAALIQKRGELTTQIQSNNQETETIMAKLNALAPIQLAMAQETEYAAGKIFLEADALAEASLQLKNLATEANLINGKTFLFTIIQNVITNQSSNVGGSGGGKSISRRGTSSPGSLKFSDFLMRPGQKPIEFSPDDTIIGMKNPGAIGGGKSIIINISQVVGLDADEIADSLSRRLGDILTTI